MNTYHIHYFGMLSERRGLAEETIQHPADNPAVLYHELHQKHSLGLAQADIRVAVNDQMVSWSHSLADNDNIAFLPPMSGG